MKINLTQEQVLTLYLENQISLEDIDIEDRTNFIVSNANKLLIEAFINKDFKQLEILFKIKEIELIFFKEIKLLIQTAKSNYLENLPENNFITEFVWSMSRQDFAEKRQFFQDVNNLVLNHNEEMKDFFALSVGEGNSGFRKYQPFGLFYLRVIDKDVNVLLENNIIAIDLFSPNTKDTIGHCFYQYSFETNKVIIANIEKVKNLSDFLIAKNELGITSLDKLCSDLRTKNITTLEYLFLEKLELKLFKKEFLNYIIKCSHVIGNKQAKKATKERIFQSLNLLFNMESLQSDRELKEEVAKTISNKTETGIQYLWLNAKLQPKGVVEKKINKI